MKKHTSHHPILQKTQLICLLVAALFSTSAYAEAQGENRKLSPFNKIEISGAYTVTLVQGNEESITIDASDKVAGSIITKVEKGTLEIYNDKNQNLRGDIHITINFKSVEEIQSSGAIKISSKMALKMPKLELEMSGATNSDLEINTEALEVEISGSGKINLKGKAKSVEVEISGTGNYNAEELNADKYEISISGVGKATVNVSTKLNVQISGTGSVSYKGDPEIKQDISGMGSLKKI